MSTSKNKKRTTSKDGIIEEITATTKNDQEENLLERSKYSLDLVNTWINSADAKVSISCGMVSLIITVLTIVLEMGMKSIDTTAIPNACMLRISLALRFLTAISFFVSIILHLVAIMPNFSGGNKNSKKSFSIFYEDIKNQKSAEAYIAVARQVTPEEYTNEVLAEVYYNSKVCSGKMKKFRAAIIFAIISVISILSSSAFYFLAY